MTGHPDALPPPGTRIGSYELIRELGRDDARDMGDVGNTGSTGDTEQSGPTRRGAIRPAKPRRRRI
jgi:hypothetical protein